MRTAITFIAAILVLTACDTDRRPSYEELKSENDQLQTRLADTHEKIEQAKSDSTTSEARFATLKMNHVTKTQLAILAPRLTMWTPRLMKQKKRATERFGESPDGFFGPIRQSKLQP